jgi:6-phosphogluconolactonase (cycloisomerase 2 family)
MRYLAAASIIGSMLAALLTGGGCGRGLFPEVTPTTSITATPVTNAYLYATNFNDGSVSAFARNTSTGAITFIAKQSAGAAGGPAGVAVPIQNDLVFVANASDGNLYEYLIGATGNIANIAKVSSGTTPQLVAIDETGNYVYVTNAGSQTVSEYRINSDDSLTSIDTLSGFTGQPFGIVTHPSAEFAYVSDNTAGVIYSLAIASDGTLSEISEIDSIGRPGELAIDPSGQFLFSDDTVAGTVSVFTFESNGSLVLSGTFGSGGEKPVGIAAMDGNAKTTNEFVFTANMTGNFVLPFLNSGGTLTQQIGITDNTAPTGLAIDPAGLFAYTGNSGNGSIGLIGIASSQCSGGGNCLIRTYASENPANSSAGTQYVATTH